MKKILFSKNEDILYSNKRLLIYKKSKMIFRFSILKLAKKMFGTLTSFQKMFRWPVLLLISALVLLIFKHILYINLSVSLKIHCRVE